ncbi:hypothetical protein, partial [Acinetobacter johnsonii]|uniref:hypothetical protein n=1 Tax=Acinetobacter johnsonii TaxID=40214 RepID=UPI001C088C15
FSGFLPLTTNSLRVSSNFLTVRIAISVKAQNKNSLLLIFMNKLCQKKAHQMMSFFTVIK